MHVIKPYVYAYNINIEKISGAKCYSKETKKKKNLITIPILTLKIEIKSIPPPSGSATNPPSPPLGRTWVQNPIIAHRLDDLSFSFLLK